MSAVAPPVAPPPAPPTPRKSPLPGNGVTRLPRGGRRPRPKGLAASPLLGGGGWGAGEPSGGASAEIGPGRVYVFAGVLVLLALLLLSRLWYLQILMGSDFRAQAQKNRTARTRMVAPRGIIEDSDGKALVTNGAQFVVYVTLADMPRKKDERQAILDRLASLLETTPNELSAKIAKQSAMRGGRTNEAVAVVEGASQHIVARIVENGGRLPGVRADVEPIRKYEEKTASHLLGYIGRINQTELEHSTSAHKDANDQIGKEGVEKRYDDLLSGVPGGIRYEVDSRGRRQRVAGQEAPQAGATLRLSIDRAAQRAAETGLGGRAGAVVALDPRSGRVLAMASGPDYDSNTLVVTPLPKTVVKALYDKDAKPYLNRALIGAAPGSTFKVVTAAAGLATGYGAPGDYVHCAGGMRIGKTWKKCHSTHGSVGFERAMAVSCDTFFYRAGLRMKATKLASWAENFGLGAQTGIDLPQERAGRVPTPEGRRRMHVRNPKAFPNAGWYDGDTANVAIGQGDVMATPLQMAQVAAAVANNGTMYQPYVVQEATSPAGERVYSATPQITRQLPLSRRQIGSLNSAMRAVVTSGTSRSASIPNLYVAGKSGSAELYRGGPTNAWFIAFAGKPNRTPEIALCVFLETKPGGRGLHGGEVAAPVARQVIEAYFARQKQREAAALAATAEKKLVVRTLAKTPR